MLAINTNKMRPDNITPNPPAAQASFTGGTDTTMVARPPIARKPMTPKLISPEYPHCILTPIDITAEIKQRLRIARATPQDCTKPTIISSRAMTPKASFISRLFLK